MSKKLHVLNLWDTPYILYKISKLQICTYIRNLIEEDCSITLNKIKTKILEEKGMSLSVAIMHRVIADFEYSDVLYQQQTRWTHVSIFPYLLLTHAAIPSESFGKRNILNAHDLIVLVCLKCTFNKFCTLQLHFQGLKNAKG